MNPNQSWDHVANWYDSIVGQKGQYFHQHVIFPKLLDLLELRAGLRILDLGCGQGVLARALAEKKAIVTGVDASASLLQLASKYQNQPAGRQGPNVKFQKDDARTLRSLENQTFDRVVSVLAIQNIDPIDGMFARISQLLALHGSFVAVLLHPSFRSPRITGWGEDTSRKLQYRRVDRYMNPMKIPIDMHPGQRERQLTWTYHRPLADYVNLGAQNGLVVDSIQEWISDKTSEGKFAKMENLARAEIPMFMAIRYRKISQ